MGNSNTNKDFYMFLQFFPLFYIFKSLMNHIIELFI